MPERQTISRTLTDYGVKQIQIEFEGARDEGGITEIVFRNANQEPVEIPDENFSNGIAEWATDVIRGEGFDYISGGVTRGGQIVLNQDVKLSGFDGWSGRLEVNFGFMSGEGMPLFRSDIHTLMVSSPRDDLQDDDPGFAPGIGF